MSSMYIKTDFHIYEIKSEEIIQGEKYYNIEIRGGLNKLKAEFGKQANTIEELLDRYVLYEKGFNDYQIFQAKTLNGGWLQYYKKFYEEITVYGAIWTDKGLIYVAKMDSEGKLELI